MFDYRCESIDIKHSRSRYNKVHYFIKRIISGNDEMYDDNIKYFNFEDYNEIVYRKLFEIDMKYRLSPHHHNEPPLLYPRYEDVYRP